MPFITQNSGICLSEEGVSNFSACGPIVRESDASYVFTEKELKIYTDNSCSDSTTKFDCNFKRTIVDSGRFVKITNTCTLPIEITGFVNSDPVRFSLFEYPKYRNQGSMYTVDNTEQLPITLNPTDSFKIPTFFHPLISELETGNAGIIQDVHDQELPIDVFGARVDIYPGFPISNCSTDENDCDAYFTLTGSFLCEDPGEREWMENQDNFIPADLSEFDPDIENDVCINKTPSLEFTTDGWVDDLDFMQKLDESILSYSEEITNGGKDIAELYKHIGMSGALGGMRRMIQGKNNVNELINGSLSDEEVVYTYDNKSYSMTVNYDSQKNSIMNIDGLDFTGLFYDIVGGQDARSQTVFINSRQETIISLFVADEGDYDAVDFCEEE